MGVEEECVHKYGMALKKSVHVRETDLLFRSTNMKDFSEISPAYMKAYKNISKKSSADH